MKKDRNSFFQEANFFQSQQMPMPQAVNQPFTTTASANQSFYQSTPNMMPINYNTPNMGMPQNYNQNDYSDIESRLSKIERQLNRMDARISKLESGTFYTTEEIDNSTNMYMV